MRCICCKNHVHIVLGKGDVQSLRPSQFGWPLFSQEEVLIVEKSLLDNKETELKERMDTEAFFKRVVSHTKRQKRLPNGTFCGSHLPKNQAHIARNTRPQFWLNFLHGKDPVCFVHYEHIAGPLLGALHDCSLIEYEVMSERNLSRSGKIGGKCHFRIQSNLDIIE